jgi:hypothetical protein
MMTESIASSIDALLAVVEAVSAVVGVYRVAVRLTWSLFFFYQR